MLPACDYCHCNFALQFERMVLFVLGFSMGSKWLFLAVLNSLFAEILEWVRPGFTQRVRFQSDLSASVSDSERQFCHFIFTFL